MLVAGLRAFARTGENIPFKFAKTLEQLVVFVLSRDVIHLRVELARLIPASKTQQAFHFQAVLYFLLDYVC